MMTMRATCAVVVAVLMLCLTWTPTSSLAAEGTPQSTADKNATPKQIELVKDQAKNASLFSFDYGIPTSPALALAGLSPDKTSTSTSLKPFVLALPGLFGSSGNTSAALDLSLAWLVDAQNRAPTVAYQNDYGMRLGYRTRLGLALYRGDTGGSDPTKSKPSRVAFGLSTSLLDTSDPVMATPSPWKGAGRDGKGSAWDACLSTPGGPMLPYLVDKDHKMAIITRNLNVLANYLADIGGNNAGKPEDVVTLEPAHQATIHRIESDLRQIANVTTDAATDPFTRGRLSRDVAASEAYLNSSSKEQTAHDQKALAFIQNCEKVGSTAAQHGADLEVGGGVVWSGDPGKWANFRHPNAAVWVAGRIPLDFGVRRPTDCGEKDDRSAGRRMFSCWMIGGSGRYSAGEVDATGNKATPQFEANVTEGWLGFERLDAHSKFGGYYGYMDQAAVHGADKAFAKSGSRWLVSAAYSLSFVQDGLWIQGSYGSADGSVSTLDDKVALLSVSFGPPKIGSGFVNSGIGD